MLYFVIFRYHMRICIRKYKCEYIIYILSLLVYYFVPKAFVCDIKYKALSEYSTLIGQFPS